ncbi:MAG: YtxH domain-containing protein [bacterium]
MAENEKIEVRETKRGIGWPGVLLAFGAGSIVGAITALLYAPQSGKDTREKIKDRFSDISDSAGELIDKSKEAFEEAKDKMSTAYSSAVEKTSSAIEHAKEKLAKKKEGEE